MDMRPLLHELYGLNPGDFTAARNARAQEARRAGDKEGAADIKALRKPSMAAYAVNLMARTHGAEIDHLIDLGERLREAQEALSGDELRALGRQRGRLVSGLAVQARHEVARSGHQIGDSVQREIEATFEAALADPAAGAAVRAGCLIRSLTRSGMEPVALEGAVAGSGRPRRGVGAGAHRAAAAQREQAERAEQADRAEQAERAEQAAARAEARAREAEAECDAAMVRQEEAARRRQAIDDRVQRLTEDLAEARQQAEAAEATGREARGIRREAEDRADRARREATRARGVADQLAGG